MHFLFGGKYEQKRKWTYQSALSAMTLHNVENLVDGVCGETITEFDTRN